MMNASFHNQPVQRRGASALLAGPTVWLALFLLLLAWRWQTLDSPPYWDQAIGVWTEANFLAETGFDYHRLRNVEPPGTVGGSRGYVISVVPTALAVLMRQASSIHTVLVTAHVVSLMLAAVAVTGVWVVARRLAGTVCGILLACLTLTIPVFSTQVEMVGLEIPLAACSVMALVSLAAGRRRWALLACWAAFFMKATGMMFTWALTLVLACEWFCQRRRRPTDQTSRFATLLLAAVSSALQVTVAAWGTMVDVNRQQHVHAWFANYLMLPYWCPDVFIWLLVCGVAAGWLAWRGRAAWGPWLRAMLRGEGDAGLTRGENLAAAASAVVIGGVLAAILLFSFMPRYLVTIVPCLSVVTAWLIQRSGASRSAMAVVLSLAVLACLANQQGRWFPSIDARIGPEYARTGAILERSREYWPDHQQNIRLLQSLADKHPHDVIIAGHPFAYFLSLPRLGYVAQPLHGFSINPYKPLTADVHDLARADLGSVPADAIFVFAPSTYYRYSAEWDLTAPDSEDVIVAGSAAAGQPVAYRVNWPAHDVRDALQQQRWFVQRLWPWKSPLDRAQRCAEYWTARGELVEAARSVQDAIDRAGDTPELLRALGDAWLDAQQFDLAARALLASQRVALPAHDTAAELTDDVDLHGDSAESELRASLVDLSEGRSTAALAVWQRLSAGANTGARASLWLGLAYQSRDDHPAAIAHLERALSRPGENASQPAVMLAKLALGISLLRQAQTVDSADAQRAAELLTEVCQPPASAVTEQLVAEAHHELGLLRARQGERGIAVDHFRQALRHRPCWTAAKSNLASATRDEKDQPAATEPNDAAGQ